MDNSARCEDCTCPCCSASCPYCTLTVLISQLVGQGVCADVAAATAERFILAQQDA